MSVFRYVSMNEQGNIVKGQWECNNVKELMEYLNERKEYLISVDNEKINIKKLIFRQGIKLNDLSLFCKYFGTLLESGVPLLEVIKISSLQFRKGKLYDNNIYLAQGLRRGEALHEAMNNCPNNFPEFLTNMVKVGEETGNLGEVFNNLYIYYYKKGRFRKKIIEVAIYPTFVLFFSISLALVLLSTVVPSMIDLILSMGGELPLATKITLAISSFLTNYFVYIIVFIFATTLILAYLIKGGKINFSSIRKKLPIIKDIYYRSCAYDFIYAFFLLYHSGLNIVVALEEAAAVISDIQIKNQVINGANQIREGSNIVEALMNIEIIDYSTLTMIGLGEETGKLSEMLKRLLQINEEELSSRLEKLIQLLQPVSILIVGLVVASIVISVILPMFSLYRV
ncbi:General secretion pathway protein F [Clostridium sp. N3C]|uniref:type II secretion system F family protein n=1 Tax=Clostridium sp. N3C TaxID=1776758 RepID=UPI00092DFAC4|nr:type II secretion system F family protein [Clostridium sp. N3C]SCN21362.1 General secretion pathway protein F [Clostridium sp. N3C]